MEARALVIREHALGAAHPDVAASLSSFAAIDEARDDYAAAKPLYLRALAIREKALGPMHPKVASSLTDLALLYQAQRSRGPERGFGRTRGRDVDSGAPVTGFSCASSARR